LETSEQGRATVSAIDNHQDMPSKARSTRPKSNVNKTPLRQNSSTPNKRTNRQKRAPPTPPSEDGQAVSGPEDAEDGASDTYQEEDDDVKSLHSDTLDDDSDQGVRKRKHASPVKPRSPRKKRKNAKDDEDEEGEDYGLKEGQQVVGRVVQPPKKGRGKDLYTAARIINVNLSPQCPPVRYPKTRSTSFYSSQNPNATTVNGEDTLSLIRRFVTVFGYLGLDYMVCFPRINPRPVLMNTTHP